MAGSTSISVRVKRPGVRGARAARLSGVDAGRRGRGARAAAAPAKAPEAAELAEVARDRGRRRAARRLRARLPLRVQAAAGWKPGDSSSAAMWVVGELGSAAATGDAWNDGFDVTLTLSTPADATVGGGSLRVASGARTFRAAITPSQPLAAGDYVLRIGVRAGSSSVPSRETVRLAIAGGA